VLRRAVAEFLGSALLAAVVIGSGIAASTLSPGDAGLQLLESSLATALGLFAIILIFAPLSGSHFNPIVTLVDAALGHRDWRDAAAYIPAQVVGCVVGAGLSNAMFGRALVSVATTERLSGPHFLAEVVATAGLVLVIFSLALSGRGGLAPAAVGAYIGAAYFFTSSSSFANPAITIGRMFSDSFAGIAPGSVPGFLLAQAIGGGVGLLLVRYLYPSRVGSEPPAVSLAAR
jgi:glycerol uptake facilitator-like aquaporin